MSALFRGKMLAALTRARARGVPLIFAGPCADLADDAAFARMEGPPL
jgi:hypothetical protein